MRLDRDFRKACAQVDHLRAEYERLSDIHYNVALMVGDNPVLMEPFRKQVLDARAELETASGILGRLRP